MIDTIKLAIHCPIYRDSNKKEYRLENKILYNLFLDNCNQKTTGFLLNRKTGITTRETIFQLKTNSYETYEMLVLNGSLKTPSYSYEIFFRIFEERIDIEFSIPKFLYGTNSFELYTHSNYIKCSPYQLLILSIKKFFKDIFFNVPVDFGLVQINRFDFCFNQIYKNYEESIKALNYIKLKHSSVADKLNYKYGYVELTKSNYLKIYHKGEEFKKHDYKKITNPNILKFSQNILRFEKKHTPKNISYFYNCNFKNRGRHFLKEEYLKQKKAGNIKKHLRAEFENVQNFTIDTSKLPGSTKLPESLFNILYKKFIREIIQKFTIQNLSVKTLYNEVLNTTEDKILKVRILALITTFKSLKRAFDCKAVSSSTYYRYKNYLTEKNLSETNINVNIKQDFTHQSYLNSLKSFGLNPTLFAKNANF